MSLYLGLESGGHLLLTDGTSGLLLEAQDEFDVTFPLLASELVVTLTPWDGTTFPLLRSALLGTLGEVNSIDVTFPLLFSVLGNPAGSFSVSWPLLDVNLFGAVAIPVGSGLYKMVIGDLHDTYYQSVNTGSTTNVAIPEPSIQSSLYSDEEENFIHIASARIRAIGSGSLKSKVLSLDSVNSQQLADIVMAAVNNIEPAVLANFRSRRIMIKYYTENIDEFFDVSRIILFLKPIYSQRPQ